MISVYSKNDNSEPVILREHSYAGDVYVLWLNGYAYASVIQGTYSFVKQDFYRLTAGCVKTILFFLFEHLPSVFPSNITVDDVARMSAEEFKRICKASNRVQLVRCVY